MITVEPSYKRNVMNKKIYIITAVLATLFLGACQKNSDIFVPDSGQLNGPDTTWYSLITPTMPVSVLKANLQSPYYTDTFVVSSSASATINTPFGLQCTFPPACCVTTAGVPVSGTVQVELALLKKKGDIILMNKPTTSNGLLLFSGGAAFVSLKKDGQELKLAPNAKILVRFPAETFPVFPNRLFLGDESNTERFNWLPNNDPNSSLGIGSQNFEIQTTHLRWISCDSLYDTVGTPQTTIKTELPSNYTNANTTAYIVMKDYRSVIAMYGDPVTRKFVSSSRIPAGKEVTLVVISRQGNDYFMDHKTFVSTGGTVANPGQSVAMYPLITTLSNIKTYLSTL